MELEENMVSVVIKYFDTVAWSVQFVSRDAHMLFDDVTMATTPMVVACQKQWLKSTFYTKMFAFQNNARRRIDPVQKINALSKETSRVMYLDFTKNKGTLHAHTLLNMIILVVLY